jgi:2-iminobutanoate/2-iminopropanoate deaminase
LKIRIKVFAASVAIVIGALLGPGLATAFAQQKQVVNLSDTKGLPFSDGVIVGNTLYIAGQQGGDANGHLPAGGVGPETQRTLESIAKVVKAAGFELNDIVAVNVYLSDIHDFAEMNKVYKAFLPDPKPTRTTVQVSALVNQAHIEISAIAVKSK